MTTTSVEAPTRADAYTTMADPVAAEVAEAQDHPTIWGLRPVELHDRYWASRGVQVVRPGVVSELVEDAELFLLMAPQLLALFRLRPLVEQMSWLRPDFMWLRLRDEHERGYRELAQVNESGEFRRIQRVYGGSDARLARVALTDKRRLAQRWQQATDVRHGWQDLRTSVPRNHRRVATIKARTYDHHSRQEVMDFVRQLVQQWRTPAATIDRAERFTSGIWHDREASVDKQAQFIGPSWIGAGRTVQRGETVVGPAILWDDPQARPAAGHLDWRQLEPSDGPAPAGTPKPSPLSTSQRAGKRLFDIAFSAGALLLCLPIFPVVMLAIWLEDGRPFFFAQKRESRGGRIFHCLKFRSMRHDADQIKQELMEQNQVDGPQFYMENDPRLTKVGRFIRAYHIDELPQFYNVLKGDMSVVGPRPSPYEENQYCPPWREARLSVRPGITGLWQVQRTRKEGHDFQEWIKYDLEYVERTSLSLDLWILWRTVVLLLIKGEA
jgi:lipopolysaccharide/colanic/teichoic acid biosynthesis glycosyltransferase